MIDIFAHFRMASPIFSNDQAVTVVEGICNFALTLYSEIGKTTDENIFLSPASIVMALSMTYLGTKGNTAQQMKTVLGFANIDDNVIHTTMCDLLKALDTATDSKLHIANRLFGGHQYKFIDEFTGATKTHYLADLEKVNFREDPNGSRVQINQWVEQQTAEKIRDLLPDGIITPLTALVLANAIYFKGNWNSQFKTSATKAAPFYKTPSLTAEVQMMSQKNVFNLGFNKELKAQAIELPYTDEHLSMVIILPQAKDGLAHVQNNIRAAHLMNPKDAFKMAKGHNKIDLSVPQFKLSESCDLKATLTTLGMADLFMDGVADLSGMTGDKMLFVSAVMHSSHIEVNEEGTEAAAATAVVAQYRSLPMNIPFKADHPFLFMIRDSRVNVPLFVGRYMGPEAKKEEL